MYDIKTFFILHSSDINSSIVFKRLVLCPSSGARFLHSNTIENASLVEPFFVFRLGKRMQGHPSLLHIIIWKFFVCE